MLGGHIAVVNTDAGAAGEVQTPETNLSKAGTYRTIRISNLVPPWVHRV